MPYYAHAVIETPSGKLRRGDEVDSEAIDGFDDLLEAGSVREEPYDPAQDKTPPPTSVEIDGVRYIQVSDGAEADDVRA